MSPERPASVPADARYDPDLPGWEVVARGSDGVREGECRQYRDDGTLARVDRFRAGKRVGEFSQFHPNGDLLSRGVFVDDRLDGMLLRFVSTKPGGEPLRVCCVPRSAVELRAEYRRGRLLDEVYYDAEGRPLRSDGTPWPERPPGVPVRAIFEEGSQRYLLREENDEGTAEVRRYYSDAGVPCEEVVAARGRATTRRFFDERGVLRLEHELDEKGRRSGPSRELYDAAASPLADSRVVELRGEYAHGEAIGRWQLVDATGAVVRAVERGTPFAEPPLLVLVPEPSDVGSAELLRRATAARGDGHAREALCLAARATVRAGSAEPLRTFLAESVIPLTPAAALERADRAAEADAATPSTLLDALLGGGDAARLLRALGSALPAWSHAPLDYLEASLLLAPERPLTRVSRALVRVEHGDRDGALADAKTLESDSTAAADLVREECRVAFPPFLFEPLEHPVEEAEEELGEIEMAQPLERVRWAVGLYATRLGLIRAEIARRLGSQPEWLPPDLRALLPDGPVEPQRRTVTIRDEDEEGVEETETELDETLTFEQRSTRQLLSVARADHAALSWLCWSAGLLEVALPEELRPQYLFATAANRATLRCFWAHDRVRTGGLVAMTRKVPTFAWEGISIEKLPSHLAHVAAQEYLEVRAVFLWLLFAQNVSPFQQDLRKA